MLKVYMLIVVFGLVGGAVYGGYYYYKDTQARIQVLTENNSKLELAAKTQTQTIDTLVQDAQKYASLNNELQSRLDSANDYKNELIGKLRKHDLARLSLQKPGLFEEKINNVTKRLFEKFERITSVDTDNTTDN